VTGKPDALRDDLAEDLKDPEFRHHLLESERVAAIDRIIDDLDAIRDQLGLSKAELARAIARTPETVRRLLTAKSVNPQFGVITDMAAALGYRVTLEPMSAEERREVSAPLREFVARAESRDGP
jgi:transcriptional regulator with XRE-family HTH domain